MPAYMREGPLDSGLFAGYSLDPLEQETEDLATWYDFDNAQSNPSLTGNIKMDTLPECGTLNIVDPKPVADGNGDYDVSGSTTTEVELGVSINVDMVGLVFDSTGCAPDQNAGDVAFSYAFET